MRPRRRPIEHVRPSNRDTTRINDAIRVPKVVVYGDRESPESLAIRDRGGEQTQKSLVEFVRELATL